MEIVLAIVEFLMSVVPSIVIPGLIIATAIKQKIVSKVAKVYVNKKYYVNYNVCAFIGSMVLALSGEIYGLINTISALAYLVGIIYFSKKLKPFSKNAYHAIGLATSYAMITTWAYVGFLVYKLALLVHKFKTKN